MMREQLYTNKGFTLIELMLTLVISIVIVAAIYSAYSSQRDTYLAQEQVAEMQQNLRSAMDLLISDVRMAGFDPTKNANAGIIAPTSIGSFTFTKDITGGENDGVDNDMDGSTDTPDAVDEALYGDGDFIDTNEIVTYGFSLGDDPDRDGIANSGVGKLARQNYAPLTPASPPTSNPGGFQAIAENIGAIEFNYIYKDGTRSTAPSAATLDDIRGIEVAMLARAHYPDLKFTHRSSYTTPSGRVWGPYNDNYRRRFITMTIQCRNMGL